jgi:hypothetical protein
MPLIRLLTGFIGNLEGHECPPAGAEIKVSSALAEALCDGERAERISDPKQRATRGRKTDVERAVTRPPENRAAGSTREEVRDGSQ